MDTERTLEQMIEMLRNFCIDPRVGVLNDDVFECIFIFLLSGIAHNLTEHPIKKSNDI